MAQFQSEIDLRVKVNDIEIDRLEKRIARLDKKPGNVAFKASGVLRQQLKLRKAENNLIRNRIELQKKAETAEIRANKIALADTIKRNKAAAQRAKEVERAAKAAEREASAAAKTAAANKKARTQKIQGAVAGGVISAAFPVLTGGGGAESVLGGVGGLLGSLAGPLGSFAGGIGGSAIGRLITDAEELNKSLAKLNVSLGAVGTTSAITGDDLGKLASQLGVAKDEAITLIESFNGLAAAGEAAALARQFGNVGGASTAEAIAAAAQDEASALAAIDQLRGIITLETAQQLQDTLEQEGFQVAIAGILDTVLKLNQDIAIEGAAQVEFADRLKSIWSGISDIILGIDGFKTPGQFAQERVDALGDTDTKDRLGDLRSFLEQQRRLREQYKPQKTPRAGRAPAALPQSKELQLRQQILKTELAVSNIQGKRAALFLIDLEAVRAKEQLLAASLIKETQILELARQQALINSKVPEDNALINELYDDRLKNIQAQNFLLREQNGLAEKNILLQQDLVALRNEQQTGGIVQGLERGIEDANSRSSSEMLSLRIKQLRRQEDLIGGINDKLAEQKLIEGGDDAEKAAAATREIGFLEQRKAAIEGLLPALNQAEQQQLRFNQAFAAVTPAVNSLVGGLREVVAGTKTAEEAFADFLNTIADQLINTAATMIAQYIAIGIARMFAMGGNSPGLEASGGGTPLGPLLGAMPFTGLATGGTATGNQPSIVGEEGPELFIPGVTGTVTNNDQFEAARKAMGGSSNSSSDAFADNAEAIGTSTSYTKEKVMERERIASINSSPIDVRTETTVINNVEYVTVEQFSQGMKSTARDAQAKVLSDLRNRPATRAQVGIR